MCSRARSEFCFSRCKDWTQWNLRTAGPCLFFVETLRVQSPVVMKVLLPKM